MININKVASHFAAAIDSLHKATSPLVKLFQKNVTSLTDEAMLQLDKSYYATQSKIHDIKELAEKTGAFVLSLINDLAAAFKKEVTVEELHETTEKGELIETTLWTSKAGEVVEQTSILTPEKEKLKNRLEKQLGFYTSDPEKYKTEIKYLTNKLHQFDKKSPEWASSNYVRNLLKRFQSKRIGNSFVQAKGSYLPLPVNMRWQTFNNGEEHRGAIRCGIVSDMFNGFTNLGELKEMRTNESRRKEVAATINSFYGGSKKNVSDAIEYALKEIQPENLDNTIKERRLHLQMQFLAILELHLDKNPSSTDGETFKMAHVALLNMKKKEMDKTGWYHHEENELLDMAEIFKEFDGAKLIFDGNGPYVDDKGAIHLPKQPSGKKEMKLETLIINTSVQGNTLNVGGQKIVNDAAYEKLNQGEDRNLPLNNILKKEATGYDDSGVAMATLNEEGYNTSCGCLSAKDRTPVAMMLWIVEQGMKKMSDLFKKEAVRSTFEKESLAVRIVEQNSGTKTLKVSALDIPYASKGLEGRAWRIGSITQQIPEVVKEEVRQRLT